MVILERNIRVLLDESVAYESGKTMAEPKTEAKASDIVIMVVTVMLFAFFIMGLASVCFRWGSRQFYSSRGSINTFTDSDTESRRSITASRGIDAAILESFPTFLYSEVKERRIGKGGAECAVCLCEFEDDETLRLMPTCSHVFHADCVGVWLSHHSTCPLCRVNLFFLPGQRTDLTPDPDSVESTSAHLFDGVTWTNRNIPSRSRSTRLSNCRVSQILFSRSHSTGHSVFQPVENFDRFTLRLPENVRRQLTKKTVDHVPLAQARSSRCGYRSKSAGSEKSVFSYQPNNDNDIRRLHSMTFSFSDCAWSNSVGVEAVAQPKILSTTSGERSFERFQPDDRV